MPVLKEYADSNPKDGYYVHAPISDRDHPLPLQTPEVTEEIYRELGYRPIEKGPDGGVDVPNELTWTLYNVNLHWTENSGPQGDPSDLDFDKLRDKAGPELTDNDIETILSYTEDYRGQYQSRVNDLREELAEDSETSSGSGGTVPSFQKLLEDSSSEPSFDDDVEAKLEQWEPSSIVDDDYEPEHTIGELLSTPRSEYREALASVPDLGELLQVYADHSWEVDTVRGGEGGLKVSFDTEDIPDIRDWSATDHRFSEDEQDFKIFASVGNCKFTFEISDNYISDFDTSVAHEFLDKFELPPDDYWGYEVHNQDPNEIMHTLVSNLSGLIPVLEEFFDDIPDYNLESTGLRDHSVYLP